MVIRVEKYKGLLFLMDFLFFVKYRKVVLMLLFCNLFLG